MKRPSLIVLLASLSLASAQIPEEARKLSEAHEKEVHALLLDYLHKLDALAAKYRTDGKDAEANAVEKMIAEIDGKKPDPKAEQTPEEFLKSLVGVWQRDYDNGVFVIRSTTEGVFGGKRKFTITCDPEKRVVTLAGDDWIDRLTPTADPDVVTGEPVKGKRYRLTRVK